MQSPRTYMLLLEVADRLPTEMPLVRQILNTVAVRAYAELKEPFGEEGFGDWLEALVRPKTWRSHPEWVRVLERVLNETGGASTAADGRDPGSRGEFLLN